jgi:hypothetical protein
MYRNFNFSQELEDRLNPKQNGDAQPRTTSLYARIQGKTFLYALRYVSMWAVSFSCPATCPVKRNNTVE